MKLIHALLFVSVCVMMVMIFQAVRQELNLRNLKSRMAHSIAEVKDKEQAIIQVKMKIQQLNDKLTPLKTTRDQLNQKKALSIKATREFTNELKTCVADKEKAEKTKTGLAETLQKLKADQEEAKNKAQAEIQGLKQQILDRDKSLCAFVDQTNAAARSLCGLA